MGGLYLSLIHILRGVFVGHDHINDYEGTLHGIRLCYGRGSGYQCYGLEGYAKGARIIDIGGGADFESAIYLETGEIYEQKRTRKPKQMCIRDSVKRLAVAEQAGADDAELVFEARRQNRQPHDLDQADVFFFDMVVLNVRVENPERVLLAGAVVAQREVCLLYTSRSSIETNGRAENYC